MLKGLNLFECNIYNPNLRNALMNMIGNLLHASFVILDVKLRPPLLIKSTSNLEIILLGYVDNRRLL